MSRPAVLVAKDDQEMVEVMAMYAFTAFLIEGRGVVMVNDARNKKRRLEVAVEYAPLKDAKDWHKSTVNLVKKYDPCLEMVVDMPEKEGSISHLITSNDKATTPQEVYRMVLKEKGDVPIIPGALVKMKAGYGVEPGQYVFVDQEKNALHLMETVEESGKTVVTGKSCKLHVDYAEALEETGRNMWELVRELRGK